MKITHNKIGQNLNLKDVGKADIANRLTDAKNNPSSKAEESAGAAAVTQDIGVALSPRAQQLQKAKEAAQSAPDINREKVERLKGLIQSGEYKVDADAVAERMLGEHLDWTE